MRDQNLLTSPLCHSNQWGGFGVWGHDGKYDVSVSKLGLKGSDRGGSKLAKTAFALFVISGTSSDRTRGTQRQGKAIFQSREPL